MPYDFDTPPERRGTGSLKWDVGERELPMWVADMDFAAAPPIRAAIQARAQHGVFGYAILPDAWYEAYAAWWQRRHALTIERDWLIFCTGVVPAISSIVRKLTTPNENVLLCTPVYNIFFNSIVNQGRRVLESPLLYDGTAYQIDWEDLERKLADPQTTMMILCNPHNPIGRIWDAATLSRIGELCARHHVLVLSDEIHCDLTAPGHAYVPFAAVSPLCRDNSITCLAPTKAFNLAGLQTAAVMVPDPVLRHKVWRALNTDEVAEPNAFAVDATIAAFREGADWLDALCAYVQHNRELVGAYLQQHLPALHLVAGEATYLLWIDATALSAVPGHADESFPAFLRRTTGLYLSDGAAYGESGRGFLRMNIACPTSRVQEGLERLAEGVRLWCLPQGQTAAQ